MLFKKKCNYIKGTKFTCSYFFVDISILPHFRMILAIKAKKKIYRITIRMSGLFNTGSVDKKYRAVISDMDGKVP